MFTEKPLAPFVELVSLPAHRLTFEVNRDLSHARSPYDLDALADLTGATVVTMQDEATGRWRIRDVAKGKDLQKSGVQPLASGPRQDPAWVYSLLGYEGVVTNVEGDVISVESAPEFLRADVQGLVIAGSKDLIAIGATTGEPAAVIALVDSRDTVGRFKVVVGNVKNVEPGVKVLFHRSAK